jgi:hypothetical protein
MEMVPLQARIQARTQAAQKAENFGDLTAPRLTSMRGSAQSERVRAAAPRTRPSPLTARRVQLSSARASGAGAVTVQRATLDTGTDTVVISRSRAVQIGDHNRQLNAYRFTIVNPTASVDVNGLLAGNPTAQRAFDRLVANPQSWFASYAFQSTLREGQLWTGGQISARRITDKQVMRIPINPAAPGSLGSLVVDRSKGVQLADHATQRNTFRYEVVRPALSVEAALRGQPRLARSLALAVRNPGAEAAQRAFGRELERRHAHAAGQVHNVDTPANGHSWTALMSHGVQVGTGNIRYDTAEMHARKFSVTGWQQPPEPGACSLAPLIREASKMVMERAVAAPDYLTGMTAAPSAPRPVDDKTAAALGLRLIRADGELGVALTTAPEAGRDDGQGQAVASRRPEVRLVTLTPAGSTPPVTGAVIYGSAAEVGAATRSPVLNAGVVLGYARQRLQDDLAHMPLESLRAGVRAVDSLRAVVLVDPGRGVVLQVDAGPRQPGQPRARQLTAAAGPSPRFAAYSLANILRPRLSTPASPPHPTARPEPTRHPQPARLPAPTPLPRSAGLSFPGSAASGPFPPPNPARSVRRPASPWPSSPGRSTPGRI